MVQEKIDHNLFIPLPSQYIANCPLLSIFIALRTILPLYSIPDEFSHGIEILSRKYEWEKTVNKYIQLVNLKNSKSFRGRATFICEEMPNNGISSK